MSHAKGVHQRCCYLTSLFARLLTELLAFHELSLLVPVSSVDLLSVAVEALIHSPILQSEPADLQLAIIDLKKKSRTNEILSVSSLLSDLAKD